MRSRDEVEGIVAEFCDAIGIHRMKVVFVDALRIGSHVQFVTFEMVGKRKAKRLPEPELQIEPAALDLNSQELRYRVAAALYYATPQCEAHDQRRVFFMVAPLLAWMSASAVLALLVDWKWLIGVPITFLLIPFTVLPVMLTVDRTVLESHLLATKLTGDRSMGLQLLSEGRMHPKKLGKRLQRRLQALPH